MFQTTLSLSLRARQGVAIQSEALCGMPGAMRGLPDGSAGLPRRHAPRNDKKGEGNGCRGSLLFRDTLTLRCHCDPV